jgi:hypothetical protein
MGMGRFVGTALGAAVLLLGVGCSAVDDVTGQGAGSPTPPPNGVADKPPAEILRAAQDALRGAGSVHLKGNGTEDGQVYAVDMRIKGTQAGRGTVTIRHNPVEILRVGQDAYVKGSADFWLDLTGDRAATELLKGKYLKADRSDPDLKVLLAFTDTAAFAEEALKPDGAVTKADRRTVAGVETVGVSFTSDGDKVTVYVATTGKPYPMYLSTTGRTADETSALDFTEYDEPVEVKPPAPDLVVDLAKAGN